MSPKCNNILCYVAMLYYRTINSKIIAETINNNYATFSIFVIIKLDH